jgi:ribosomal protein S6--L-glutamate ligase
MVAESEAAAVATIQTVWGLGQEVMLQQYIAEANGKDVRVFVVGGRVVGAMERSAADGEFRANIHLGASAAAIDISPEVEEIALKTAAVLGLHVAGVDVIESERGPLVLEANSSPGLQGIEGATGTDIARTVILHAESLVENEDPSAN